MNRKTRSEHSIEGFQIRESGSIMSQNSDGLQPDPILRQFEEQIKMTEGEVNDLTKDITKVKEMMHDANQIPVMMKPSQAMSDDETFQDPEMMSTAKEKMQFSKLKKIILALIALAILLIVIFIIVVLIK